MGFFPLVDGHIINPLVYIMLTLNSSNVVHNRFGAVSRVVNACLGAPRRSII